MVMEKRTNRKFLVSSMFMILAVTIFSLMPVAYALPIRKISFIFRPNPAASFDGAVDMVWIAIVESSTYGKFTMAFYRDSDDHGTHWFTENLDAGDTYADLTEAVYPTEQPKESVDLSEIDLVLEKHYLKAVIKVSGVTIFTAEFWGNENARLERYVESLPNDTDGFFSFSVRSPLTDAKVYGLNVGSFIGGVYEYLDIELYDSTLLI